MTPLEKELETALLGLYDKWKGISYRANYFKRMLMSRDPRYRKGPIGTVRHLLTGDVMPASGFRRLVKAGKLDWTVEALLQDPKWKDLPLTELEWNKARSRYQAAKPN
jgi:hypothetical protein